MSKKGIRQILIIAAIGALVVGLTYRFGPAASQQQNLRLAREHIRKIQPDIYRQSRFTNVTLGAYYGEGGCLFIGGMVSSTQDADELHSLIESSHPPIT